MKKNLIILLILFVVLLFLGLDFWNNIYLPKDTGSGKTVIFTISKGESIKTISDNLEKQGLIRSKWLFRAYVVMNKIGSKLKAGQYELSSVNSSSQIAEKIALGETIKRKITILEGWNLQDVASYLNREGIVFPSNFDSIDIEKKYDFFFGKPENSGIEGYFFPDTYEVGIGDTAYSIFVKACDNFDKKLTRELRSEIAKQNKSIFEIITMASLIEKEVKTLEDKKTVSGILWKRMKINMPLQVDATIVYYTGRKKVSIDDTRIDSLYNTYTRRGLPVGPICSPGIDSIIAAVYPKESPYLYYLSDSNGKTFFSRTFNEHLAAKAKYIK